MWNAIKTGILALSFALSLPLVALSWFAPVVAAVWLLWLHQWALVLAGVIIGIVARFLIHSPLMLLAAWAGKVSTSAFTSRAALVVYVALTFCVMVLFSLWVFAFGMKSATGNVWPFALWGFATAVTPWNPANPKAGRDDDAAIIWCSAVRFGSFGLLLALVLHGAAGSGLAFIGAALFGLLSGFVTVGERTVPSYA